MSKSKAGNRYSEEMLAELMKQNPHLKISEQHANVQNKIINESESCSHSSMSTFNKKISDVCNRLQHCEPKWDYSEKHLRILLPECRVLNGNDLLAMAQQKPNPFRLMKYKKQCHDLIKNTLQNIIIDCFSKKNTLPSLRCSPSESLKLSLFRQAKRLSDLDNMFLGFKYLIDAFHEPLNIKELGEFLILEDDDMEHISEITPYQVKGEYVLGIMFEKVPRKNDITSVESFLMLGNTHV